MKKFLLTTAAAVSFVSATSTIALADVGDTWYLGIGGNYSYLPKVAKAKAKSDFAISAFVGTYLMDNVRIEGEFSHNFDPALKLKNATATTIANPDYKEGTIGGTKEFHKHYIRSASNKLSINSLMLNAKVEFGDFGMFKPFVGVGIGWAQVKNKMSGDIKSGTATMPDNTAEAAKKLAEAAGVEKIDFAKSKNKNNLAMAGYVGGSVEVQEGVHIDGSIAVKYYGDTKFIKPTVVYKPKDKDGKVDTTDTVVTKKLMTYNVALSLRFDL